jgi:D-alanyl-D-alanine dipeptidase
VNGYYGNVSIITEAAGLALKQAQELAKEKGYELVVYDSYRPQKSVDHFVRWSEDQNDLQRKKDHYYPRTNKEEAFDLGYIARKSGHTRGSTIDLTIIPIGKRVLNPLVPRERILNDNSMILFLDDGTVDMGSSFDLFDEASHTNSTLIDENHQQMRMMFKGIMEQAGFVNYPKEWWHYTLKNEPFPETYFNFDVK